ncbi:hypothetical protein [Nocardioides plantarum]|uniref:Chemotaxis protein n=1 Tax=Nocardioides plantarum TaxID=29299 RepID=A0ABV5KER3_9ACTN|nr:hypothetical protein [Nocardioides plantarum]
MGLFKVSRTPQAQAERDVRIGARTGHQSLPELTDQLHAAGDLGLDLDEAMRSPAQRQKVDITALLKALNVANETAERALAEVITLRKELEGS